MAQNFLSRVRLVDGTQAAPALSFTGDTNTGIYWSTYSGDAKQLSIATDGVTRASFNSAGITSYANVYSESSSSFRNYSGTWQASTGLTGNGFTFVNSVDGTALTLSSTGNATFAGTIITPSTVYVGTSLAHYGDGDTNVTFDTNDLKLKAGGATHFHAASNQATILYSGNSTALTLDTSQNATFAGRVTIQDTDTESLKINGTNSNGNGSFVRYQTNGTNIGFFGAAYHLIGSAPDGYENDFGIRAESDLRFSIGATEKMSLSSSSFSVTPNATFAGTVTSTGLTLTNQNPSLNFTDSSGSTYSAQWRFKDNDLQYLWGGGIKAYFTTMGIGIGDNGTTADARIERTGSSPYGLTFKTNNTSALSLDSSQNATFSGTATATHFYGDGSNLTGITASNADTVDNLHAASFLRSDANDTATGKLTFAASFNDADGVSGGTGITPFRLSFQASNRPGSGNYFTGHEYTFSDTGARAQLGFGSDGNNTIPHIYARTEGWSGSNGWKDWYRIYHTGYHPEADEWTTARTVTFAGGDVTGSFSIDGSADVSNVNLTVADDSHNHDGRYFTETEVNDRFARKFTFDPGSGSGNRRYMRLFTVANYDASVVGKLSSAGDYGDSDRATYEIQIATRNNISFDVYQLSTDAVSDDYEFFYKTVGSTYEIWCRFGDYNKSQTFTRFSDYGTVTYNFDSSTQTTPESLTSVTKSNIYHEGHKPTLSELGAQASGNYITGSGSLSAQDLTDIGNLSGTNTGDQDLSAYITQTNADARYVLETGGSSSAMTGDLHIVTGAPKIYLQDNTDDDDQQIIFRNDGGTDEYKIATQDFTSGGGGDGFYIGSTTSDGELALVTANTTALTISTSQNATFASDVGMVTGHSSGKFAVMSTAVHGSYDFYNNGTSYFNGAVTVDDNLSVTSGNATFGGDVTVNGGDVTIAKQNDAPTMTLLHDGTNPTTNDLLFKMQFQSDYNGSHQNWGKIELDTNASSVRTNMDFYVKSTSGNEELALRLEGQGSAAPNAIFAGNVDIGANKYTLTVNAPTNLTTTIVGETINVTFTASSTSNIDYYLVFSSVAGGDYGLISVIPPDDFSATMSVIDDSFDRPGTQAYRIYAVKNGVYSSALTGSRSYTISTTEPTNMSVIAMNNVYYVQWDPPSTNPRFVANYNVYKHEHAAESSLSFSSASLVYSGTRTSYMYAISGANNNNFHKFWVTITMAS